MKIRTFAFVAAAALTSAALAGCPEQGMTLQEAGEAMDEVAVESQASALTDGTIEISTNFTIGQAVEAAAEELRTFVETQLPCAGITVDKGTLTIEYGAKPGSCVYRGQTYSGTHSVTISKNEEGEVVVDHVWDDMQNQMVAMSGTAQVTWNLKDPSRHVVYERSWTRLSDGRTGTGSGDVTQRPLAAGLAEGISIDGSRAWEGEEGTWDLGIEGVEARWEDPIPQAGSYELGAPDGKTATLSFSRVDEDSIRATFVTGKHEWVFVVNKAGQIEEKSGE